MTTSAQEEITRLIRDKRFIAENRQQAKKASHHREALERLQGDLGIGCVYIGGIRNDSSRYDRIILAA